MTRALLIVDVQNDFCEGGSLAVSGGAAVAGAISEFAQAARGSEAYQHVVATRDHHVDPGGHFSTEPDFVKSWPAHCVAGTAGADLHPGLDTGLIDAVFDKGEFAAAYSGFEAVSKSRESLADWLHRHGVDSVDVAGIATDYCVRATGLDAVRLGFAATVLTDLTAGVAPRTSAAALDELAAAGVTLH